MAEDKVKQDLDYILQNIADKEFDSEEAQKAEIYDALSKLVEEYENVDLQEDETLDVEEAKEELMVLGEVEAKKIKLLDSEKCKANFANFREERRINAVKDNFEALKRRFPLQNYSDVSMQINIGEKNLIRIRQALSKGFISDKEQYQTYKKEYEKWENILDAYNFIYVSQFDRAKENIEDIKDEKMRKALMTYMDYEDKQIKHAAILKQKEDEKKDRVTTEGYTYATTISDAKAQYNWFHLKSHYMNAEEIASVTLYMLEAAIKNKEPEEVVEYRSNRTQEFLNKWLKKASVNDYKNYVRAHGRIMDLLKTQYKKEKEEKTPSAPLRIEDKQEQLTEDNFLATVKKEMDILKQNAELGKNVKNYCDRLKEIEKLQDYLEVIKTKMSTKQYESIVLSLARAQEINEFQKVLCNSIDALTKPNATHNQKNWNKEKEEYNSILEEINACYASEGVTQWFGSLIDECNKSITIAEEEFIKFRENGGKIVDEFTEDEKGKEVRKGLDKLCKDVFMLAQKGNFKLAHQKAILIEKQYIKLKDDKRVFPNSETIEDLLGKYTDESFKKVETEITDIQNKMDNLKVRFQALQKVKNSILLQQVETMAQTLEIELNSCIQNKYDVLYAIDVQNLKLELQTIIDALPTYIEKKEEKKDPDETRRAYYEKKIHNAEEGIEEVKKQLSALLVTKEDRGKISELQKELKDRYTQIYLAKEQSIKAEIRADQKLYQKAEIAVKDSDLNALNDILNTAVQKVHKAKENLNFIKEELEKDNETCKDLGIGFKIKDNIVEELNHRYSILEEKTEYYSEKGHTIATEIEEDAKRSISFVQKELEESLVEQEDKKQIAKLQGKEFVEQENEKQIKDLQRKLEENYTRLYMAKEQPIKDEIRADQRLYKAADEAIKKEDLEKLNDIVDTLLEKRVNVQEQIVKIQKELEKSSEKCKDLGIDSTIKTNVEELMNHRLEELKVNTETYAIESNELASKLAEGEKDLSQRKGQEKFYQAMGNLTDEELAIAGKKGSEEREKEELAAIEKSSEQSVKDDIEELQAITVSKMPIQQEDIEPVDRKNEIQAEAFRQRESQLEEILANGANMSPNEIAEALVNEKYLLEQNKGVFSEKQIDYLNDLISRGQSLFEQTENNYKNRK